MHRPKAASAVVGARDPRAPAKPHRLPRPSLSAPKRPSPVAAQHAAPVPLHSEAPEVRHNLAQAVRPGCAIKKSPSAEGATLAAITAPPTGNAERWSRVSWSDYLADSETEAELTIIRRSTHTSRPLGSAEFISSLEQ